MFLLYLSIFVSALTVNNVQVSPKQLLVGTELQHHVCDPVEDSRHYIGRGEPIENTILPCHDSRPAGHTSGLHGHNYKPSADDLSHRQNVGKPVRTGLRYSHSVSHRPGNDERSQDGVRKYPQPRYHQSGFKQQRHDSRSPQFYDMMTQGGIHRQNFNDMVSVIFQSVFYLFAPVVLRSFLSYRSCGFYLICLLFPILSAS